MMLQAARARLGFRHRHSEGRPPLPHTPPAGPLHHLKELEAENARLRKAVADLTLDKQLLQEVITKKL